MVTESRYRHIHVPLDPDMSPFRMIAMVAGAMRREGATDEDIEAVRSLPVGDPVELINLLGKWVDTR